jgi:hypothetical protein
MYLWAFLPWKGISGGQDLICMLQREKQEEAICSEMKMLEVGADLPVIKNRHPCNPGSEAFKATNDFIHTQCFIKDK